MIALDEHEENTIKYLQKSKEEFEKFLSYRVGETDGSLSIYLYCQALLEVISFNLPRKEFEQYREEHADALVALKDYTYELIRSKRSGVPLDEVY